VRYISFRSSSLQTYYYSEEEDKEDNEEEEDEPKEQTAFSTTFCPRCQKCCSLGSIRVREDG
jgi:hypothetical protein